MYDIQSNTASLYGSMRKLVGGPVQRGNRNTLFLEGRYGSHLDLSFQTTVESINHCPSRPSRRSINVPPDATAMSFSNATSVKTLHRRPSQMPRPSRCYSDVLLECQVRQDATAISV